MSRIDKHADYYRGYLADDRSLAPVAGVLVTATAVWLLFYLVSLVGPAPGLTAAHPHVTPPPAGWIAGAAAR